MIADTFEQYRPLLFSIAYRMLGSAMEAEDMVQEAFLRAQAAENIQYPKAYLSQVVTRLCLDHLKSAQVQREEYIGPWLPEPIYTEDTFNQQETISLAFLVLLESLTPIERAVFLLREVFDYDYAEIAGMVGKSEANCRQHYHRAKQYMVEHRPRFHPSKEEQQRMIGGLLQAWATGEIDQVVHLLAEDVALWSDGGGKATAALHPLFGQERVGKFLLGIYNRKPDNARVEVRDINGLPALIVWLGDQLFSVMSFVAENGKIHEIRNVLNPDKLSRLEKQLSS